MNDEIGGFGKSMVQPVWLDTSFSSLRHHEIALSNLGTLGQSPEIDPILEDEELLLPLRQTNNNVYYYFSDKGGVRPSPSRIKPHGLT